MGWRGAVTNQTPRCTCASYTIRLLGAPGWRCDMAPRSEACAACTRQAARFPSPLYLHTAPSRVLRYLSITGDAVAGLVGGAIGISRLPLDRARPCRARSPGMMSLHHLHATVGPLPLHAIPYRPHASVHPPHLPHLVAGLPATLLRMHRMCWPHIRTTSLFVPHRRVPNEEQERPRRRVPNEEQEPRRYAAHGCT